MIDEKLAREMEDAFRWWSTRAGRDALKSDDGYHPDRFAFMAGYCAAEKRIRELEAKLAARDEAVKAAIAEIREKYNAPHETMGIDGELSKIVADECEEILHRHYPATEQPASGPTLRQELEALEERWSQSDDESTQNCAIELCGLLAKHRKEQPNQPAHGAENGKGG